MLEVFIEFAMRGNSKDAAVNMLLLQEIRDLLATKVRKNSRNALPSWDFSSFHTKVAIRSL
jgi:large-conductance mechanosensitive channel